MRCGPEDRAFGNDDSRISAGFVTCRLTGLRAACSIVVHLCKEVAATFGRHVEESPERIDKIAGAMVLLEREEQSSSLSPRSA